MLRHTTRLVAGGAVVALALWLTGCGDGNKTADPKVVSPDAKKLPVQTPPPVGGGGPDAKGGSKTGVN